MKHFVILFSFFFISCNNNDEIISSEIKNLKATIAYNEIEGIDPNLLSLDIYYTNEIEVKKPVVIWVHGGGWCIGDKANQIENKIALFKSLGYVFVSVNYRLSPFPYELDNPDRIMFPTHPNDLTDAIKWVHNSIAQYGGNETKIALLGHSAGAHLVSLLGTNQSFIENVGLNTSAIKGIASIDTEGYDVLEKVTENSNLYINAFGTDSTQNTLASPILNIEQGLSYPKFFIAKRGNANRIAIANNFITALTEQGVDVSQIDGSIYNHEGINNAIGASNETLITNALTFFFERCFE